MRKNILIICFTDIARDPRVKRQISFLKDSYDLTILGSGDPGIAGITYLHCPFSHHTARQKVAPFLLLAARQYEKHYWRQSFTQSALKLLENRRYDLLIANEINSLPLAVAVARGAKVLFDAHEFYPGLRDEYLWWRLCFNPYFDRICSSYLPRTDAWVTVSDGIATEYQRRYRLPAAAIITNAPDLSSIAPSRTDARRIKLVYHGMAAPTRRLENILNTFRLLDGRFELHLIFSPGSDQKYITKLKRLALRLGNISFPPPVPSDRVIDCLSQYDIGIYLFEPTNINNRMALPNKFYEFIQARLAIAIGPSPEMAKLVNKYNLGLVANSFAPADLARLLNALPADRIDEFKHNSDRAAMALSAQSNRTILLDLVGSLIGS